MCVEATTHQKPSLKRVILFGARGRKGYQPSSPSRTGDATENARIPYLLNNQHRTETQAAPAGLLPTDASSRHFFHVHTMCPLCTTAICISLGSRENLIASGGTRRAVDIIEPPPPPPLFYRYARLNLRSSRQNIFLSVRTGE